ncbi:phosphonate metabolism protein/1,5-bisphosphokinase (PRPP-forming) PhnN [Halovulum sp. GXIMD14793]
MSGRLIGVVGPSGVGKDTLMAALCAARPDFQLVRRVITRPAELGGEDYTPATEAEFDRMKAAGAFCIDWPAHGLRYGIPVEVRDNVAAGQSMLINLSRAVLLDVAAAFPAFSVLNVTADPETLAARLAARGRETAEDITRRLAQANRPLPEGLPVLTISNDGPLENTVAEALDLLAAEVA